MFRKKSRCSEREKIQQVMLHKNLKIATQAGTLFDELLKRRSADVEMKKENPSKKTIFDHIQGMKDSKKVIEIDSASSDSDEVSATEHRMSGLREHHVIGRIVAVGNNHSSICRSW